MKITENRWFKEVDKVSIIQYSNLANALNADPCTALEFPVNQKEAHAKKDHLFCPIYARLWLARSEPRGTSYSLEGGSGRLPEGPSRLSGEPI